MRAYLDLLRTPGAGRLVASSLIARLHLGVLGLPLLLLAEDATGSYAGAGAASAAFGAGIALFAPTRGRLIDRWGARRALPPLLAGHTASLAALAFADAGWLAVAACAVSGASAPSLPAAMRVEWQRLLEGPRLQVAYAFEAMAQVSVFVVGPVLAGIGVAAAGARTTMLVSCAVALVGGNAFAVLSRAGGAPEVAGATRPIRLRGVRTLVVATLLSDVALGAFDVGVVAFADARGHPAAGGYMLAIFSLSSVAGGAFYGTRTWRMGPGRRLAVIMATGALATAPLALADSILVLAALLLVAGLPFAAQFTAATQALDEVTPPGVGAEAYNWLSTANSIGFALGCLLAGILIETVGTRPAFLAGTASLLLAAAYMRATWRT